MVLVVTGHVDKQGPVLEIKNRAMYGPSKYVMHGQPLRRCLPVIRDIVANVRDKYGMPLGYSYGGPPGYRLNDYSFRGSLPLDGEANAKLTLIFILQRGVKDMDRVELIAHSVARFSREEAEYWLGRTRDFGRDANRWAVAGMRVMLGGPAGDSEIQQVLERVRR